MDDVCCFPACDRNVRYVFYPCKHTFCYECLNMYIYILTEKSRVVQNMIWKEVVCQMDDVKPNRLAEKSRLKKVAKKYRRTLKKTVFSNSSRKYKSKEVLKVCPLCKINCESIYVELEEGVDEEDIVLQCFDCEERDRSFKTFLCEYLKFKKKQIVNCFFHSFKNDKPDPKHDRK